MKNFDDLVFKNFEYRYINQPLLNNLVIMDIGHERCKPSKRKIGPERRDHISIHYVVKGKGILTVDGKLHKIGPNQLFITPFDTVCCYYPDNDDPWEYLWITFKGSRCLQLCEMMGMTAESPIYTPCNKGAIFRAFSDLIVHSKAFHYAVNFFVLSKLFQIICIVNEERKITVHFNTDKKENTIQSVIGYIERNYGNPELLSLKTIADWIHLDAIYLNRIFKKETGCTVHKYIINYRLLKAGELIEHADLSFAEIAHITGWNDYAQFSKSFSSYYGVPPSKYKISK